VRGEHPSTPRSALRNLGSSPRARGAPIGDAIERVEKGIIPACAGSTCGCTCAHTGAGDHPRVRGEHEADFGVVLTELGSSPRARGALLAARRAEQERGIIPACAGSTRVSAQAAGRPGDHPRVRGEHICTTQSKISKMGSSPRARGAHGAPGLRAGKPGIIPACAGSTVPRCTNPVPVWDHPRVRGEHQQLGNNNSIASGSSPRARGALPLSAGGFSEPGIIPACAGSTVPRGAWPGPHGDHPRVRGEHCRPRPRPGHDPGSSPRARGAPSRRRSSTHALGIIPACAGSTVDPYDSPRRIWDHPRVRGEHRPVIGRPCGRAGSSPRARGAQRIGSTSGIAAGIIPACAGIIPACAGSTSRHPRSRS